MNEITENIKIEYLGEVKKIQLNKNDTLVIMTEMSLSSEVVTNIRKELHKCFPDHPKEKILILTRGLKIGVISNEKILV